MAEPLISLTKPTHGGAPFFAHFAKGGNVESQLILRNALLSQFFFGLPTASL